MAYVGIGNRQDYIADFQSQNFSGDGSTTAFTLNYEAVTGSIRVAVDNVLQPADGSSYTCNGFTLNFSAAPASGTDNITVLFLGTVRNISSVSDGAIVASKLASNAVETAKILDGAVTEAKLASGVNTITMADQWRLSAATNANTDADVTTNWERVDNSGWGSIGTGLTESSGIFSFPQTGIYYIDCVACFTIAANDTTTSLQFLFSSDGGSTYEQMAQARAGDPSATSNVSGSGSLLALLDVDNITNWKFKFATSSFGSGTSLQGNTGVSLTHFTVIRLGDT